MGPVFALLLFTAGAAAQPLPCRADGALAEAAAAALLETHAPGPSRLAELVREAGSDATAARAIVLRRWEAARARRFVAELRTGADAPIECGVAHGADRWVVVAAARGGHLDPIDADQLRIRLAPGFGDARIVVRAADGSLLHAPVGEIATLPPDLPRPLHVQLVARGRLGPRPVAERVIDDGPAAAPDPAAAPTPEPRSSGSDTAASESTTSAAAVVDRWVSDLRAEERALPLRPNRLLAVVASTHAARVCREGRVAHELDGGADPEQRLRAAGISARVVGEVVARGASAGDAVEGLARSPSHRMTVVDRRFTDGGQGVAVAGGRTCVVVLLAAWPRVMPP